MAKQNKNSKTIKLSKQESGKKIKKYTGGWMSMLGSMGGKGGGGGASGGGGGGAGMGQMGGALMDQVGTHTPSATAAKYSNMLGDALALWGTTQNDKKAMKMAATAKNFSAASSVIAEEERKDIQGAAKIVKGYYTGDYGSMIEGAKQAGDDGNTKASEKGVIQGKDLEVKKKTDIGKKKAPVEEAPIDNTNLNYKKPGNLPANDGSYIARKGLKFTNSMKPTKKYPKGSGGEPKTSKKQAEESRKKREERFKNAPANVDSLINSEAIKMKKNEHGLPIGGQKSKVDPPKTNTPRFRTTKEYFGGMGGGMGSGGGGGLSNVMGMFSKKKQGGGGAAGGSATGGKTMKFKKGKGKC